MAIAFDNGSDFRFTTSGSSNAFSVGAITNGLLVVGAYTNIAANDITAMTYGGVALTKLAEQSFLTDYIDLWYLLNPPTGSNNLVPTYGGSGNVDVVIGSWSGVSQSGFPDAQAQSFQLAGTTFTQTITPVAANCWGIVVEASQRDISASTGTTFRAQRGTGFVFLGDSNGSLSVGANNMVTNISESTRTGGIIISIAPFTDITQRVYPTLPMMGVG